MATTRVTRVYAYIDSWNFYCAINEQRRLRYGWCNFVKLADALALKLFAEKTRLVKYFNTPVEQKKDQINEGELERSRMWFRALEIETGLKPICGRFKKDETSITKRREKETDVHLAVDMLSDAPNYDAALLVSADTDFRPLIRKLAGDQERPLWFATWRRGRRGRKPTCCFRTGERSRYQIRCSKIADYKTKFEILVPVRLSCGTTTSQ